MTEGSFGLPRSGLAGAWDLAVGPGADSTETGLVVASMIAGPGLAVAWARLAGVDWDWWQWAVLALLACELAGGLVANSLAPAKRWHHRPQRGPRAHFAYCAMHIHPIVLALATPDALSLREALMIYGFLLAGGGLTIMTAGRLKPAVALISCAIGTVVCGIWTPSASPEGWLPVVLFLKAIAAYLLPPSDPLVPRGPWS